MDPQALFYMRSRGVSEAAARALLIEAFLAETIPEAVQGEVREDVEALMRGWLREDAV